MKNYNNFHGDVDWQYWDAGFGESPALQNPWEWVRTIGSAIFDGDTAQEDRNTSVVDAPSLCPSLTQQIVNLSDTSGKPVPWLGAIQAVNRTDGSLSRALDEVGLGEGSARRFI